MSRYSSGSQTTLYTVNEEVRSYREACSSSFDWLMGALNFDRGIGNTSFCSQDSDKLLTCGKLWLFTLLEEQVFYIYLVYGEFVLLLNPEGLFSIFSVIY